MPEVAAPAAPAPPSAPAAPAPPPAPGSVKAAALAGFDKFAREPSTSPDVIPDHPSTTARKANEAAQKPAPAKPAPVKDSVDPGAVADKEEAETAGDDRGVGTDTTKPSDQKVGEPAKAKRPSDFLREELAKQKARAEAYEKELTALKAPKEDPEKKELTEKLTAAEKRAQEREDELRFTNYERSEEYQTKYFKPYVDAYNTARHKVSSLDVTENDVVRAATPEDFDRIVQIPDDRTARHVAKEMFGEDYTIAMAQRERVLELNSARVNALKEQREKGAEREKTMAEQKTKAQAEAAKRNTELWASANKEFAEKHKDWFEPIEGDEVGNKMLANDLATTDAMFGDTSHLPPEKVVKLHSEMRNRAAAAGRLAYRLKMVQKELAEAQEKLKGFEGSEPKEGEGVAEKTEMNGASAMARAQSSFDKLAKPQSNFF